MLNEINNNIPPSDNPSNSGENFENSENLEKKPTNISLDIHSMPSTSEESLKTWYILGGVVLFIVFIIFLIFLI